MFKKLVIKSNTAQIAQKSAELRWQLVAMEMWKN